jgi:phosphopantetheinyl transferase
VNVAASAWMIRTQSSLAREFAGAERCWLHAQEREQLARFRSPERQASWLWGRVMAKRLLLAAIEDRHLSPWNIRVDSRDAAERGTAPTAWLNGSLLPFQISVSHSGRFVAAAIAETGQAPIGIDVVDRAVAASLTQFQTANHGQCAVTQWAVKEAAFKCLPGSESFRPGRFEVERSDNLNHQWHYAGETSIRGAAHVIQHSQYVLAFATHQASSVTPSFSSIPAPTGAEFAEAL